MDREIVISNIKAFSKMRGEAQTTACINAKVGKSFISHIRDGQVPGVDKFELLAQYLGVTVSDLLGETKPDILALDKDRNKLVIEVKSGTSRMTKNESAVLSAYRRANAEDKEVVETLLKRYMKKEKSTSVG